MSLNNVWGCQLNFDRDTGTMTRDNFSKQPCKDSRSDSWRATTSNPPHADDIYLKIERAHAHDRYLWSINKLLFLNNFFQVEYGTWEQNQKLVMGTGFLLQLMLRLQLVRNIPHSREFIFFFQRLKKCPLWMPTTWPTMTTTMAKWRSAKTKPMSSSASSAKPPEWDLSQPSSGLSVTNHLLLQPSLIRTLSDDVDINLIPELQNATTEATTSEVSQVTETDKTEYFDMTQELGLPVIGWLDSKVLGCRVAINDSNGNNLAPNASPADLTLNVTFVVEGSVPDLCQTRIWLFMSSSTRSFDGSGDLSGRNF